MDKERDLFSEIIKEKLTNYSLPVDDDSWREIEKRLNPATRKKTQGKWIAAIAVAASIALLFLLLPTNKKTLPHETANQLPGHEETIIQNLPEKGTGQPVLSQNVEPPKIVRKSQSLRQLAENKPADEVIPPESAPEENSPATEKKETTVAEKHPVSVKPPLDIEKETPMTVTKRKKRQSIRFSVGSGGSLLAENNTNPNLQEDAVTSGFVFFRASAQSVNDSRTRDILSYEDYPEIHYHLPLSFGITVEKELNRTFSIESGIVYTFLETTFNRETPKSTADLWLHYLGIPLNLQTRLFGDRSSQWKVYLSTGGMLEKGIQSHFLQKNIYENNAVFSTTSNEKIEGLQWSVNASPGVDYQIYRNYSIYLEPKISYYFDNNQPVSARTKHPVVIGINAGIRYTWK